MKKVLTVLPLKQEHKELLYAVSPELEFFHAQPGEADSSVIKNADIIIGNLPPGRVREAEHLQLLQLNSAGCDGYLAPGVLPEGARLCNATGAYGLAISEHMLGMLLMMIKKLNRYYDNQKQHQWKDEGQVTSIWGTRTLVVGMGDIGTEFGRKMHALGSMVEGVRRHKTAVPEFAQAVYTMDEMEKVLGKADIVACSLPGTKETFHLFDAERIGKMKPGAILINVGRGSLIEEKALAEALRSGKLGGACLDVTEQEPLPEDSPLWEAPNLILTPHVSGHLHLEETWNRIVRIAAENLSALLEGRELRNEVDPETGCRRFRG